MSDFATYRPSTVSLAAAAAPTAPSTLPQEALDHFKLQIEEILRGYGVPLPLKGWVHVDKTTIETLDFTYEERAVHLYASIRRLELGFGISYLTDYGVREVLSAPPAIAGQEAAAAVARTFHRAEYRGASGPPA